MPVPFPMTAYRFAAAGAAEPVPNADEIRETESLLTEQPEAYKPYLSEENMRIAAMLKAQQTYSPRFDRKNTAAVRDHHALTAFF